MKKQFAYIMVMFIAIQSFAQVQLFEQVRTEKEFKFQVYDAEQRLKDKSTKSLAHLGLGNLYYYGYRFTTFSPKAITDYEQSFKHFKKAQKDHPKAIYNLGHFYYNGYAVKKNIKKAVKYFEKAANTNNPLAMLMLAIIYDKGDGIPKDDKLASDWVIKATKIMHQSSTEDDLEKPEQYLKQWGIVTESLALAFIYSYPE